MVYIYTIHAHAMLNSLGHEREDLYNYVPNEGVEVLMVLHGAKVLSWQLMAINGLI